MPSNAILYVMFDIIDEFANKLNNECHSLLSPKRQCLILGCDLIYRLYHIIDKHIKGFTNQFYQLCHLLVLQGDVLSTLGTHSNGYFEQL